ncbi:kinase-like domain-containing protein [Pilobolus umbonatus]|nr:kinase-like domain-containing protein [Pilobolus umbonatus]
MLSSARNSTIHNQQAKLAVDYNELLKELSSHEMTSVGCYTIGETIGEGTYGKVKKGYHKFTGKPVAIKKINKQHAPMMAREIHHHRQLKHPNILMLYEMITTESHIHIISEYCPSGDLLDALTNSGRCSEVRVNKWFHQLIDAIQYCHCLGIVHRDLKLENILLDIDDNIKICDFGFARQTQKNQYLETFCGSLSYSAPEVILHKKYTGPETDIWSLGVILYTLLAGEYPFDDDSEIMTQRKIVQVDYEMPSYFNPELKDLIHQMLQLNPMDRISIDKILTHPWTLKYDVMIPDDMVSKRSPRYSAPTFRPMTTMMPKRTSLPNLPTSDPIVNMSPNEKKLFAALTTAGFDRDTLIKMQTGECDTSSTLWHLLLENMDTENYRKSAIPDQFIQAIKPYPTPAPTPTKTIQTEGFGSPQTKDNHWLTSVKSWFSKPTTSPTNIPAMVQAPPSTLSPPVYRTGSQKHRRRNLQLSDPPISELDQFSYTTATKKASIPCTTISPINTITLKQQQQLRPSQIVMPPTALSSNCMEDSFSLLTKDQSTKEIDICTQRYSMLYHNVPEEDDISDFSSTSSSECDSDELNDSGISNASTKCSNEAIETPVETKPRNRFEFVNPRSRLSVYGMQDNRSFGLGAKVIIEEEEEEEE